MGHDQNEMSLYERLLAYSRTDTYPFHMPGHKRRGPVFENPFRWDLTEIEGFDDLHHPQGVLRETMELASRIYGSDESWILVNGSSSGILAAVCAAARPGDRILMARNCHKSVYYGALINCLETEYLYPAYWDSFACFGGITAEQIKEALKQAKKKIQAVIITSPTYEGVVSDIKGIAEVVHRYGALLIVDEAHGAHFPFHSYFPDSSLSLGADIVVQSLHKTLPSLTQTALLHVQGDRADRERIRKYLRIFQSSSPSYVLMASIDQCLRYLASDQIRSDMDWYVTELKKLRNDLENLDKIKLLSPDFVDQYGIFQLDCGKLVISSEGTSFSGADISRLLIDQYGIQPEMHTNVTVNLMTSVADERKGYERLRDALREIDRQTKKTSVLNHEKWAPCIALTKMKMAEAAAAAGVWLPLEESLGYVSGDFVCACPPGIPLLTPGEEITAVCIQRIREYLMAGLEVQGVNRSEETGVFCGDSEMLQILVSM